MLVRRKCAAIGEVIVAATSPRSYISLPLLALTMFIHRKYRSRELIDILSSLVLAERYNEVMKLVNVQLKDNSFLRRTL